MNALVDPFLANPFLTHALIGGGLVAIACGIVGTFMVLRGLAFIGDALAHGVLPGIATALILGLPGFLGAAVGSGLMIGGISLITRKSRLGADTAIGLLFVGMLALGVVIVSQGHGLTGDLIKVLFGEILGISTTDLVVQAAFTLAIAATAFIFRRPFLLLCFSSDQADVSGFSSRLYHSIMLAMVAITVIISFQTVGTLLVFGMLIAPAAAAALLTRRVGSMMLVAAGLGIIAVYLGLLASYYSRLAAGASITLTAVLLFFGVLLVANLRGSRASRAKHS